MTWRNATEGVPYRCIAAIGWVSLAFLAGCSEAPAPGVPPLPAAEANWDAQVAAVREGRSDEIRVSESVVAAGQFRELATGCDGLATLVLDRADLSDGDLAPLAALPKLRWLKLPSAVGDDGAATIAGCRSLELLNLPAAVLTDAGLAQLATLDRLTLLRFGSPNVTDEGLKSLRGLRLRSLHLIGVPITDAGLESVAAIPTLESFYLDGGNTTDAGLRKLIERRPDLHFHKDQLHLPGDPNADVHE
jgi:hypothetical protein